MAKNVYDKPSAFGLTLVGTVEADLWYEFDITAAWEKDGRVYAARDSGNSSVDRLHVEPDPLPGPGGPERARLHQGQHGVRERHGRCEQTSRVKARAWVRLTGRAAT